MPTFPTLSSGSMTVDSSLDAEAIAMYPSTLTYKYETRVIRTLGDQEQRWTVHGELFRCILDFKDVNGYDMSVIRHFFRTQIGMNVALDLSSTFDITLRGQNFAYCCFDQDELHVTVGSGETYSFSLKIKQLRRNT